ncbi:MAG: hypothetical protein ACOZQL_12505 [Myxococcota bacterium]
MTRSWLTFALGLVLLISPLRALWAHPGASAFTIFAVWAGLVVLGWGLSRGRR